MKTNPSAIRSGRASVLFFLLVAGDACATKPRELLKGTDFHGGLAVYAGFQDATDLLALQETEPTLVHGLQTDRVLVKKTRDSLVNRRCYGKISADWFQGTRLPYRDNLVNVFLCGEQETIPEQEILRVLVPGGIAFLKQGKTWRRLLKPRPPEMDEWTHFLHGADNNAVAADSLVGPPREVQWIAEPRWARSHDHLATVSAVVSSRGRLFAILDEGPTQSVALPPRWRLVARDAFNGVLLWKRKIPSWEGHLRNFRSGPPELPRRLVAEGDRVYVTLGYGEPVTALDAATGRRVRVYQQTRNALEIVKKGNLLFVVAGDRPPDNADGKAIPNRPEQVWHWWPIYEDVPPVKRLLALDADTGDLLWERSDEETAQLLPLTLAAAKDRVLFQNYEHLVALGREDGAVVWKIPRSANRRRPSWSAPTLVIYEDVVLSADRSAREPPPQAPLPRGPNQWIVSSLGGNAPLGELIAFDLKTGRELWRSDCREGYNISTDVLVARDLVWTGNLVGKNDPGITAARDVHTGEPAFSRPADPKQFKILMAHHRCYRNKASKDYLILGRDGIELIDLVSGEGEANPWVRGGCQYGVMPCNGLLYAPPHSCACHIESKIHSFNALAPENDVSDKGLEISLEKGPSYGAVPRHTEESQEDWPTYRHDPSRSGASPAVILPPLHKTWSLCLQKDARLTAPVVVGKRLFFCQSEAHTVHCLDAEKGKPVWRYTAGGRIDSPPTVKDGALLFGCADGWIYCLDAKDGSLAWRSRVSPRQKLVVAYGQLESAWPIHGSLLVRDERVLAAAGRSSYLDGGLHLVSLDLATGSPVHQVHLDSHEPGVPGSLPDILSFQDGSLFMRNRRFDLAFRFQEETVPHLYSPAGFLDDLWWHRTYWLFGNRMQSGWGAWPNMGQRVPAGRLLVVRGEELYGFGRLRQYHRNGSHVGLGKTRYRLFSQRRMDPKKAPPERKPSQKNKPKEDFELVWSEAVDLQARGMVLADDTLFVAGPRDVYPEPDASIDHPYHIQDPEALDRQSRLLSGGAQGSLIAVSGRDGSLLWDTDMEAVPAWDSLIASRDGLFLCLENGVVQRWDGS